MVFFDCNACGEALKKNQVEKHYMTKCRSCQVLSCVDCGKDFWGNDYQQHTKCISEEEKYSGKDWKPKPNANKGEAKQEQWIQQVQMAIDKSGSNPKLQNMLQRLKDYPNIPRKKAKFENFLKNSLRIWDGKLVAQVWEVLEQQVQQNKEETTSEKSTSVESKDCSNTNSVTEAANQNGDIKKLSKRERKEERRKDKNKVEKKDKVNDESEPDTKKKKKHKKDKDEEQEERNHKNHKQKRKRDAEEDIIPSKKVKSCDDLGSDGQNEADLGSDGQNEADENEDEGPSQKFSWEATIIGVLKKASDNELSVKKLKKKVLAEYNARGGDGKTNSEEKLLAKFNKKINKNPRLKVLKDRVKLKH